jgi:O-antigen/teichoic acid export membrane protein
LRKGPTHIVSTLGKIALPSGNAFAYQVQFALVLYIPTLVVAHLTTPEQTAIFGSVIQLAVLGISSLNLLFQPLTAAIANAHSHADMGWITRNHRRTFLLVVLIGVGAILAGATIGPFVIRLWLHAGSAAPAALVAALASCFFAMAVIQLEFFVLSAMGALRGVGIGSLAIGVGALILGSLSCLKFGAVGMATGLAIGLSLSAVWLYWRAWQVMHADVST